MPSATGMMFGGTAAAQVHVAIFADYTAADAQKLMNDLDALHTAYGDTVQFAVKALVNPQQQHAQKSAEAVVCADAQEGYAAFIAPYFCVVRNYLHLKILRPILRHLCRQHNWIQHNLMIA